MLKTSLLWASGGVALMAQQNVMITGGAIGPGGPGPVGAISTFRVMAGEMVGGSPVKGAPYSADAVTESIQTLADGNRIVNNSSAMVYRDSFGRERREQSLPSLGPLTAQSTPAKTIFISDPVAGVNYSLDPNTKTAIKLQAVKPVDLPPMPPPGANAQAVIVRSYTGAASSGANTMYFQSGSGGNVSAPAVEQLGSQVINGVSADGTRTTITIPAGQIGNDKPLQIVDEAWRSSELQVIVQSQHSDPRMGSTTYSLTNVSRSEPSPTLFQVPADYTVQDAPAKLKMALPVPPR